MQQIGRYRVLRALARGGMGQVFLAQDPALRRKVAIKLLDRDPNQSLQHEARTLASLSHPNIVTIFEIGEHEGRDFIAMEYLPGRTLREVLDAQPAPSREELFAILSSVTVALAAAHRANVLHRDVKPENIVIATTGVKVVDFGIARRLEERATNASQPKEIAEILTGPSKIEDLVPSDVETVFGTPAYMAPELLHGEPSTAASDVYSLGIVVYECIAGRRPYEANNLIETITRIIGEPPAKLVDPLGDLVARMMDRDPSKRPPLGEIGAALAPKSAQRRSLWAVTAIAGVVVAGGAVAFAVTRDNPAPAAEAERQVAVAVAPVQTRMPTWGVFQPNSTEVTKTIATLLGQVTKVRLRGIPIADGKVESAKARDAEYLLELVIDEDADRPKLVASVTLTEVATGVQVVRQRLERPSTEGQDLYYDALDRAVSAIATGAKVDRKPNRAAANAAIAEGRLEIDEGDFDAARTAFDHAVALDPSAADGWYGLALSLAWTDAEEDLVMQACEQAVARTAPGPRKELVRGLALFARGRNGEARAVLEPLEATMTGSERNELYYFLGETNWHDGRYTEGVDYFMKALKLSPKTRPFAVHVGQYHVARRNGDKARFAYGAAGFDTTEIDLAVGNYDAVLAGTHAGFRLSAKVIRELPYTDDEVAASGPFDAAAFRVARTAGDRDLAGARVAFDELWAKFVEGHRMTSNDFFILENLGETLVTAEMGEQASKLVKLLADHSARRPRRSYHRLSTLTAVLVNDGALVTRFDLSEREKQLVAAVDAELTGDRKTAAKLLGELVANPSYHWDYPERAALIRNLRKLGRTKDADAICKDTLHPAVFRHAYLPIRALCRR